jgi:uncharacterized membrane protein
MPIVSETLRSREGLLGAARSAALPRRSSTAVLAVVTALAAAAWVVVVGLWAVWRHDHFLSHRFDLGNMVQAVWSTAHGRPLDATNSLTGEQVIRLSGHVDPILVLLAPLWWIYPGPEILILAQAALLASGVYPAVRLALKHVGSPLAAGLLGIWYLVFPWTVWIAFDDFHPLTLATPFLLYAIWFLDEHRLGRFAAVAVLAMMTGELIGLTVAALGVWYAIRYRRRRAGLGIALAGVIWTVVCLAVVIPAFNDGRSSRHYELFETTGGSPTGVLTTLFTDPAAIVAQVTTTSDLLYPLKLLLPTALLALGQPLLLLVAVPQLGVNLLAEWIAATLPMFHYVAPIIPVLTAATVLTVARLPEKFRVLAAGAVLGSATLILVSYPPVPGSQGFAFADTEPPARTAAMRAALDLVPPDAPVTATNRLGAHLSARRYLYLFPLRRDADWAVVDTRDVRPTPAGERADRSNLRRHVERLDHDTDWRMVFDDEGVRVYRRVE